MMSNRRGYAFHRMNNLGERERERKKIGSLDIALEVMGNLFMSEINGRFYILHRLIIETCEPACCIALVTFSNRLGWIQIFRVHSENKLAAQTFDCS